MTRNIPIIDGHIDLAWNNIALGRRFEDSVIEKRSKDSVEIVRTEGEATVGFPEVKNANIRIIFGTIWLETKDSIYPTIGPKFSSIEEARFWADKQFSYYEALLQNNGCMFIKNASDVSRVLYSNEYTFSILPIIEGLEFVESDCDLQQWVDRGIRIIAPIWQKNKYGGCSELGGGLTKEGFSLLQSLQKHKVAIDISHMSDDAANDVFDTYEGLVINTHTACRHFVSDTRLISDCQIKKIQERNGVIGLMTWGDKLKGNLTVEIDDYIDHICHVANVAGNTDLIGIGSSMDGGYGVASLPKGMNSIQSLELLYDAMLRRSFSDKEIEGILYRNWERILMAIY